MKMYLKYFLLSAATTALIFRVPQIRSFVVGS